MTPRILFAGEFHWNAGSAQMIAQYSRVAGEAGCEVGVSTQLSRLDDRVGTYLPLVEDVNWATHLVLVFESGPFLIDGRRELAESIPRHRRIILDPDGHWGDLITDGVDSNGAWEGVDAPTGNRRWNDLYADLSDVVLQPRVGSPLPAGAEFFSYFGMPDPATTEGPGHARTNPRYDLQYVGANWWRWDQMVKVFEGGLAAGIPTDRLRLAGRWWTGDPHPRHRAATSNDPDWLAARGIDVVDPVPFGQVVAAMGEAAITPILARPVLSRMGLLTPRMFETLASASLPVFGDDIGYLGDIYGADAHALRLGQDTAGAIRRILTDPDTHLDATRRIRREVHARFRYEAVVKQLLSFLN